MSAIERQERLRFAGLGHDWKSARYLSNSGIRNAGFMSETQRSPQVGSPSATLKFIGDRKTSDEGLTARSPGAFGSSYESATFMEPPLPKATMINYQKTHYDPISHVEVPRHTNLTANRLKAIGQFADQTRYFSNNPVVEYAKTLQTHPRAFFRRSGGFTKYSELCLTSSKPAFLQPISLYSKKA